MTKNCIIPTKKKWILGLTGKYCAGKNHIALLLEKRSIPVLDIDKLGHLVIENEKERLLKRFGEEILDAQGLIDRRLLAGKVFGNPKELSDLEEIIHPEVNRKTIAWIEEREEEICVINAALLHRSAIVDMLDVVIIIKAPFIVRLNRAIKRDRLPLVKLLKRFRSQKKFTSQIKSAIKSKFKEKKTDIYIVKNPASLNDQDRRLENRIDEILLFKQKRALQE